MRKLFALAILIGTSVFVPSALAVFPAPTEKYQHNAVLTQDEFAIYWNVTADSNIVLEVISKSMNWLGFGFSFDETQKDTDVFVAWSSINNDGNILRNKQVNTKAESRGDFFIIFIKVPDILVIVIRKTEESS